jgi:LAO/AO transport system kinase
MTADPSPGTVLADLVRRAGTGDARAVGRLITLIERDSAALRPLAGLLAPSTGRSHVIGLTGPPGVGKSTATAALVEVLRGRGQRVGVLAVDPSSPFSGGALLGDRIRMQQHALDREVFIRSMATKGHLGGLAVAVPQAVRVLEAAGCDTVLIETVGVGQSEVDVVGQADTTLVLTAPGLGDGVQAAKAGILEIADVFVVNKADLPGADLVRKDLRAMRSLGGRHSVPGAWRPPIVGIVAEDGGTGRGLAELVDELDRHRDWASRNGDLAGRRAARARAEVEGLAIAELRRRIAVADGVEPGVELVDLVARGALDAYTAAERLLARLSRPHAPAAAADAAPSP